MRSPVLTSTEFSAYKNFTLKERLKLKLQLRTDFQNVFDQAYFGRLVAARVQGSRFGQLDPSQGNQPRVVALVMKLLF